MKGKFRSLSYKIWRIMTLVIVIFFSIILVINITVIKKIKYDFIFDRLEERSKKMNLDFKRKKLEAFPPIDSPLYRIPFTEHFTLEQNTKTMEIQILPTFSENIMIKANPRFVNLIINDLKQNKTKTNKKILKDNKIIILYYIVWEDSSQDENSLIADIFFIMIPKNNDLEIGLFIGIISLIFICFFISKIIARIIAEPAQKLEKFAEEIAKRNWKAIVPKTENDEIGLLAEALEKMRDSLKIAEERDRYFLQATSHDLKTPVMIIKGYAQSLIDGIRIQSEKSEAEVIKTEAERLERKITQLLKLNTLSHSLEYGESRKDISIDRILNNLISKFKVIRPELNWNVHLKNIEVNGDSEALLIAFENIIENQLRYAKNLISIMMTIDNNPTIAISNDGPKFEIDDPNTLFEAYKKDRSGNFGLGLSIAKQVIMSHNGIISACNLEKGVEFKIIFNT